MILSASAVVLGGSRGPLAQQMVTGADTARIPNFVPSGNAGEQPSPPLPFLELPHFNGLGGFHRDGKEYAIYLDQSRTTPAPWANVMANENFGALTTESGLGFTWSRNSQANRLTPWHNDPVSDPQSEVIYLRDDESAPCGRPRRCLSARRTRIARGTAKATVCLSTTTMPENSHYSFDDPGETYCRRHYCSKPATDYYHFADRFARRQHEH